MTPRKIHFEVFKRTGDKGAWKLVEATDSRAAAIKLADSLVATQQATGAKVMKETFHEATGVYQPLQIYGAGQAADKNKKTGKFDGPEDATPCFQPLDLFTLHARRAIARLIPDHLARSRLTAIEMIHRPDALETLSRTGTVIQHAIQKTAIAQAQTTGQDAQSIVRLLNDLTSKAIEIVYKDFRSGRFPKIGPEGLAHTFRSVAKQADADYLLNCAIAQHIAEKGTWGEKLSALLELMDDIALDDPDRQPCLAAIDRFIAEILLGQAAITELLGNVQSLGEALLVLADLFLGRLSRETHEVAPGLLTLSGEFANQRLSQSRTAVGQRILRELKSMRPLMQSTLDQEVKIARQIASRMVMGQGRDLPLEQITEAFTARSKRFVAAEAVEAYAALFEGAAEKAEKLLALEENIVGRENKRALAAFLLPIITSFPFESELAKEKMGALYSLKRLRAMQCKIRDSRFQDPSKDALIEAIGSVAAKVEDRTGFFTMIERKSPTPIDLTLTLLRLLHADALPEGQVHRKAGALISSCLSSQAFKKAMAAIGPDHPQAPKAGELKQLLKRAAPAPASAASA